jgi:hypothetical protein
MAMNWPQHHQLGVAGDLGAGKAGGEAVRRVAGDADDAAAIDLGQERTHVGAVMPTDDSDRFHAALIRIAL